MNRQIMHMDADAFFASVEQGYNPRLRGKPVIVGGYPQEKGCVHTASYEARRLGIRTGMSLREAHRICPAAVFLKGDYRQYKAAGDTVRRILEDYSPRIERASLDDSYADLTGTERRFGDAVSVAREIKRRIYESLGITVSAGIASSKLVARIASGLQKPDGLTVVRPGFEREFLKDLPAREIPGVGRRTGEMLGEMGIHTIGKLAAVPKNVMISLFGANGEKIWKYAQGIDARPVEGRKLAKQVSRETSFPESTEDEKLIGGMLVYLVERIAGKLRQEGWTARTVRIRARYRSGADDARSRSINLPTDDTRTLCRTAVEIYGELPGRRSAVSFVSAAVMEIDYKQSGQGDLFSDPGTPEPNDVLNRSVDAVRRQFGFSAVSSGATLEMKNHYRREKHGYILRTPALSQ